MKLKANQNFEDRSGVLRLAGEQYLIRKVGSYLPDTYEEVVGIVQGTVITDKICIHLRATKTFEDIYKIRRNAGEEWIITNKMSQVHIQDVGEELVKIDKAITLNSRQYCFISNPYDHTIKTNRWGCRMLVKGEKTFFLMPGEILENGTTEDIKILAEDEALLLQATQQHIEDGKERKAGDRWILRGPREYVPPVEVKIIEKRKAIPLDANEGIYVRNNRTGEVSTVKGQTYLLDAHEELWEKILPDNVENLLARS